MFADPLVFTIDTVAKNLIRINQDGYGSEWKLKLTTGEYTAKIRHSTYNDKTRGGLKVERHNVELVYRGYAVAPATQDTIIKQYLVFETDYSMDIAASDGVIVGFAAFFSAANVTKLQNWES
nr:MAG: hypothetical protein 2 [Leviviridae sp.]